MFNFGKLLFFDIIVGWENVFFNCLCFGDWKFRLGLLVWIFFLVVNKFFWFKLGSLEMFLEELVYVLKVDLIICFFLDNEGDLVRFVILVFLILVGEKIGDIVFVSML